MGLMKAARMVDTTQRWCLETLIKMRALENEHEAKVAAEFAYLLEHGKFPPKPGRHDQAWRRQQGKLVAFLEKSDG